MTGGDGFVLRFVGDSSPAVLGTVQAALRSRGVRVQVGDEELAEPGVAVLLPPVPGVPAIGDAEVVVRTPHAPEVRVPLDPGRPDDTAERVLDFLERRGLLPPEDVYSESEENEVAARLEALGYLE
jgi:hypothetical protein